MTIDARALTEIKRFADSIILPGSHCDSLTGVPIEDTLVRCHCEFWLKKEMKQRHTLTIVTGGQGRGVKKYLSVNSSATEAGQIIKYAVDNGQAPDEYICEDKALCTLGNLVFSTKALLQYGLRCPVFISGDAEQITRLQVMAPHWFGRSGIEPQFYLIEDEMAPKDSIGTRIINSVVRSAQHGRPGERQGLLFSMEFTEGTVPLLSSRWEDNKWAFEVAIRWLFRFVREKGELRYPQAYNLSELLKDVLADKKSTPCY